MFGMGDGSVMKKIGLIGVVLLGMATGAWAEVAISNVRVEQRGGTDLVDIYYDFQITGHGGTFPVMLTINNGTNPVSAASATGAVGTNQSSGNNKHIVWNAGTDWGAYHGTTNMSFRVNVSAVATRPTGGDTSATGWEVVNTRWVRNFYTNGAITMSDRNTSLIWVFDANARARATWTAAKSACNNLSYAGYSDWFLPSGSQLAAMYSQTSVFVDVQVADPYNWYWSSSAVNASASSAVRMSDGLLAALDNSGVLWPWPCRTGP